MKKFLLFWLLASCPLFGQATTGAHRVNQVISRANSGLTAQVVPGARVYVTLTAGGGAASIYYDPALSFTIPGSMVTTDTNGNYNYYYALNTCLTETTSAPGQGNIVTPNICSTSGSSSSGITALTGDVTAAGTGSVAALVTRVNGLLIPASASCVGTNSSNQFISTSCSGGAGAYLLAPSGSQSVTSYQGTGTTWIGTNTAATNNSVTYLNTLTTSGAAGWDGGGIYGWQTVKNANFNFSSASAGIAQVLGMQFTHTAKGDTAGLYSYLTAFGGNTTGADEAITHEVLHTQQLGWFSGPISTGGTGVTALAVSAVTCNGAGYSCSQLSSQGEQWAVGGIVYDQSQPLGTLTIGALTSYSSTAFEYTLSSGTVTPSTAVGIVSSCPTNPSQGHYGVYQTTVCNVTLTSGTFTTSSNAFFNGNYVEEAQVTAVGTPSGGVQQITLSTQMPLFAGTIIMQGGPGGESFTATGASVPVAYWVIGALDSSHLLFSNCLTGTCGDKLGGNLIQPGSVVIVPSTITMTVSGSTVTATWTSSNQPAYVGPTAVVSGCTNTSLNGSFTVTYNSNNIFNPSLQWTNAGASNGGAGCVISTPPQQITLYPSAWINGSNNNGFTSFNVSTNHVAWNSGDTIIGAPAAQVQMSSLNIYQGQNSATTGSNPSQGIYIDDIGPSQQTQNIRLQNNSANGAGQSSISISGSYLNPIQLAYRPQYNGAVIYISPYDVDGIAKPFYIFKDNSSSGFIDDVPNTRYISTQELYVGTYGSPAHVCTSTNSVCQTATNFISTGAASTVSSGQISYGGTTAAASNCGSLAGSTGCVVINIGGTTAYIPKW